MPRLVHGPSAIHAPARSDGLFGLRFASCRVNGTELTKSAACATETYVKARQAGEIWVMGLFLSVTPEANKIALNPGQKK